MINNNRLAMFFDTYGKYRTLLVLRKMTQQQLADVGIAPELLAKGLSAWPWRDTSDQWVAHREEFRKSISAQPVVININPTEPAPVSGALTAAA